MGSSGINSPIYIAPLRYQPQSKPAQYRPSNVRNVGTTFREEAERPQSYKASPPRSVSRPELDNNYVDSAYDPFFPGFGAKLAVEKPRTPVVSLSSLSEADQ